MGYFVDPLIIEARDIVECTVHWSPQTDRDIQSGKNDNTPEMKIAVAALKKAEKFREELKLLREFNRQLRCYIYDKAPDRREFVCVKFDSLLKDFT